MNPYETDNVADVLDRALEMGIDERRLRMNQVSTDSFIHSFVQVDRIPPSTVCVKKVEE